jgi:uncharacterized membrane protein required for colicin V production
MGTEFFWMYDAVVVLIVLETGFSGYKNGILKSVSGLVAMIVAVIISWVASPILAEFSYDTFIDGKITQRINTEFDKVTDKVSIIDLGKIDMSKALFNGKSVGELDFSPDTAGNVVLDMTNVNLSKTGIKNLDMYNFGLSPETDYNNLNAGKIIINENELVKVNGKTPEETETYEENLVLSKLLANTLLKSLAEYDSPMKSELETIKNTANIISEFVPQFSKGRDKTGTDALSSVIFVLREATSNQINTNFGHIISEKLVKPVAVSAIKVLIFFVIFVIISVILYFIVTRLVDFINYVPVVGSMNKFLGLLLGFAEALVVIFVLSALLEFIITITGNEVVAFNTFTIERTYLFRHFYNLVM